LFQNLIWMMSQRNPAAAWVLSVLLEKVEEFYQDHLPTNPDDPKADWTNVRLHCVTVAERSLAMWQNLYGQETAILLVLGALLHDACKKYEIEYTAANGKNWEAFDRAYRHAENQLQKAGFPSEVIALASSVGHDSVPKMEAILRIATPDPLESAELIVHYVDDFTLKSQPVMPAADGVNDLDRRMTANEKNPNYQQLNQEGRKHFGGLSCYEKQREVGKKIERRLAHLLVVEPLLLPETVDQWVQEMKQGQV
jgi:hypothetical protein